MTPMFNGICGFFSQNYRKICLVVKLTYYLPTFIMMAHWQMQIYNSFQIVHNESIILQTSKPCLQSNNENIFLNNLNSHQHSSLGFFSELLKHSSSQMVSSSRPFWIPTLAIVYDQRWENKIWHFLTCIISRGPIIPVLLPHLVFLQPEEY